MNGELQYSILDKTTYSISVNDYIDTAFKVIPSNAIINKGRCGIGGTTLELSSDRNSIIVVPSTAIINNKMTSHKELIGVHSTINNGTILAQFEERLAQDKLIKIMVTPESLKRAITLLHKLDIEVFKNFFLLLDECHTYITEGDYRGRMLEVFEMFFGFTHKSMISATPIELLDPKFKSLQIHEITFHDYVEPAITIVHASSIKNGLVELVRQTRSFENSNMHVFYNSVTGVSNLINYIGEEEVSVFCAINERNKGVMGEYQHLMKDIDKELKVHSKINFYTCKYFEGWDLFDDSDPSIVLVSDIYKSKTCFDIDTKGVQALGRYRGSGASLYHLTNVKNFNMGSYESNSTTSLDRVKGAEAFSRVLNTANLTTEVSESIAYSAKDMVKENNGVYEPNYMSLDTADYKFRASYTYTNVELIQTAWERSGYKTTLIKCRFQEVESNNRLSKPNQFKLAVETFEDYHKFHQEPGFKIDFFLVGEQERFQKAIPKAYEYYQLLGIDKIKELGYKEKEIKKYILLQNISKYEVSSTISGLLDGYFTEYKFYSSKYIKSVLEEVYSKIEGFDKSVKASDINKFYNTGGETVQWLVGKATKGYVLISKK